MINCGTGSCHQQKTDDDNCHTYSNQYQIVLAKRKILFIHIKYYFSLFSSKHYHT